MRLPVVRRAGCLLIVFAGISPASRSAAQNPPDLVVSSSQRTAGPRSEWVSTI